MEGDISRNTIFVLVILTLLISVLGTWTVLSQINAGPAQPPAQEHPVSSGQVGFTLVAPPGPPMGDATGHVAFEIRKQ